VTEAGTSAVECRHQVSLDWLSATVSGPPADELVGELGHALRLRAEACRPLKGYRGYSAAAALMNGGETLVTVMWADGRDPLVVVPGSYSTRVGEELLRWSHQCSRKDGAVDIFEVDSFEAICKLAESMARERGYSTDVRGDWLTPGGPKGRTLYVMSRKSPTFVRIYEHSKLHGGEVETRIEVEVKPDKKPGKLQLVSLDARGVVGLCSFAVDLLARFGVDLERVPIVNYVRQLSDLDTRLVRMFNQWGPTLLELFKREDVEFAPGGDMSRIGEALVQAHVILEDRRRRAKENSARVPLPALICL
jgi:hypothetical protein